MRDYSTSPAIKGNTLEELRDAYSRSYSKTFPGPATCDQCGFHSKHSSYGFTTVNQTKKLCIVCKMRRQNLLPLRVAPDALEAFLETCMNESPRKAICEIARALPNLTFRELALYLEGAAHFEEVEGGLRVVVTL